jgi:thiamine biosynthesis protein ThiI
MSSRIEYIFLPGAAQGPDSAVNVPQAFTPTHLVVHYNELALKGKNRDWFEDILLRNLRSALEGLDGLHVRRTFGRMLVELPSADDASTWRMAVERLQGIFGVAYLLPVQRVEPTLEALADAAEGSVLGEISSRTFGVKCKRGTKDFPFDSMDVQRHVGARIQQATGWQVDLDEPSLPVRIELVNRDAFLGFGRVNGPGGLPTGVAGKVVCLLSGGIDSPVAAYRLLRRGATAVYAHFHSYPHTGIESQEKVRELASRIQPPGRRGRLYMIPFADLQRRIVTDCPARLRVILYRRFMVRTADAVARQEGALALVTGESLGQVASQTLENLRTIDQVATLPILRPLIGLDKAEIVAEAERIGTFATSIEPHGDCCSFLMPPNPATHSTPEELAKAEAALDVDREVKALLAASEVLEVAPRLPPVSSQ